MTTEAELQQLFDTFLPKIQKYIEDGHTELALRFCDQIVKSAFGQMGRNDLYEEVRQIIVGHL